MPGPSRDASRGISSTRSRDVKLDPDRALLVLAETNFYTAADWRLDLLVDPAVWFSGVMAAINDALASVAPAAVLALGDQYPQRASSRHRRWAII